MIDVSRETRDRLELFVQLLTRWNSTINLIGRTTVDEIWRRHIADCLQLCAFLPAQIGVAADLGSGAGFPGLVLALASSWHFHLIEADKRKAAFLQEAVRLTGAAASVHATRVQETTLRKMALITARALAPLDSLFGLAHPMLEPEGVCLFLKGRSVTQEIAAARQTWRFDLERHPSRTDPHGAVLRVSGLQLG